MGINANIILLDVLYYYDTHAYGTLGTPEIILVIIEAAASCLTCWTGVGLRVQELQQKPESCNFATTSRELRD